MRSVKELERSFVPAGPAATSSWWSMGESDSAAATTGMAEDEVSPEDEMVYLSFSWWLMNVGWREVAERVELDPCLKSEQGDGVKGGEGSGES